MANGGRFKVDVELLVYHCVDRSYVTFFWKNLGRSNGFRTRRFVRWIERLLIPHWYLFTIDTHMEYTVQRPIENPCMLTEAFDHVVESKDVLETSVQTSLDQYRISRDVQSVILRQTQT
eukprot:scaffold1077_cov344-Pavlova_lutheri.AAC.6